MSLPLPAQRRTSLVFPLLTGLLSFGCGSVEVDESMMQPPVTVERTYHQDAKAVLERYCVNCHQKGGIGPFVLTDFATAQSHAAVIKHEVETGAMPPWLPSDDSLPLRYSRKMRAEDKQLLLDWIAGGAVEGDASAPSRVTIP